MGDIQKGMDGRMACSMDVSNEYTQIANKGEEGLANAEPDSFHDTKIQQSKQKSYALHDGGTIAGY